MVRFASLLGFALALLISPEALFAQVGFLDGIVNGVIAGTPLTTNIPLPSFTCPSGAGIGACRLAGLLLYTVERGRWLIAGIALVVLVIAAFTLIIRQSEESLTAAKRSVVGVVSGVFVLFLSERFVDALYGGFTINPGEVFINTANVQDAAFIISAELFGILRWAETLVAIIAVGLLTLQGAAVLGSFGSEETTRKAYRAVFSTIVGILLIVFDRTIAALFSFDQMAALPNPNGPNASVFFVEVFGFVRLLLGFVGIVAVAIVVYAGVLMLASFGNDEMVTKARTVLINAAIGLVLIVVSFTIVHTVILGIT